MPKSERFEVKVKLVGAKSVHVPIKEVREQFKQEYDALMKSKFLAEAERKIQKRLQSAIARDLPEARDFIKSSIKKQEEDFASLIAVLRGEIQKVSQIRQENKKFLEDIEADLHARLDEELNK